MVRYVIGDIHGRLKALRQVFERSKFDFENDSLIFLGDIVDRGEDPFGCIFFLDKVKNKILIQGNHDYNFFSYVMSGHDGFNGSHGSMITKILWQQVARLEDRESVLTFLKDQVEYYIDEKNNCFVHGGFDKDHLISEQTDMVYLCWDRELWKKAMSCKGNQKLKTKNGFKEIFIGHTPTIMWGKKEKKSGGIIIGLDTQINYPMHSGGVWNMDTGAAYKEGKLSMMNIDTKEIFQSDLIADLYEL